MKSLISNNFSHNPVLNASAAQFVKYYSTVTPVFELNTYDASLKAETNSGTSIGSWSSVIPKGLNVDLIKHESMETCIKTTNSSSGMIFKQFPWYPLTFPENPENLIYELRVYKLLPGKLPLWSQIFQNGIQARLQFSSPLGIFFSEIGDLNVICHIWPYLSGQDRDNVRENAVKNDTWVTTVKETMPLISEMNSKILIPRK